MITVRKAEDRGRFRNGWLDSRHTFSFGHYYDPQHMGVSLLRVINDDNVTPGAGFGKCGQGYIRISAFNSFENVTEAMERISKALK